MSTKSFKKNFSLIELLAVIAIMSMLIAIVGVAMKPDPVNSASRELSSAILKARSYALSKRRYTLVHITLEEGKFTQIAPIAIYKDADCTDQTKLTVTIIPGSTNNYLNKGTSIESGDTLENKGEFYISFGPSGAINVPTSLASKYIDKDGKYYIEIVNRRDPNNKLRFTINELTGSTRFEEPI